MRTYNLDDFKQAQAEITQFEAEEESQAQTAKSVIRDGYDLIKEKVKGGVSYKRILESYQRAGLDINLSTLRRYMNEISKERRAAKAKERRERKKLEQAAAPLKPQRNPSGVTPKISKVETVDAEIING